MARFKPTRKRIALVLVLAWLLVALASPLLMPAWSQTTYTVEYIPVDDAYVHSSNPDTNYGSDTRLKVDSYYATVYSYIKFDLSNFTLHVERIVSAKLRLYVFSYSNSESYELTVKHVSDDSWSEESITYNNKPGAESSPSASSQVSGNTWIEIDVTNILVQKISENDKIISFRLERCFAADFASKEYSEADKWPRLIIEYEPYTETQTQTITETVTITETATETATETVTVTETETVTETVIGDTVTVTETQTITATETATVNTTVTDYVTETQTITTTITDTVYTTETAYTTSTVTTTQTITDVITETATTTITQTETIWANETVTVTTTITPTTTITETVEGNATLAEQSVDYQALADMLMPIVLIVGVIGTLLGLLLQSTNFRRGD